MADPFAQTLGGRDFAVGDRAAGGAFLHHATTAASGPAGLASAGGQGFARLVVCTDAGLAAAGLGDDFGIGRTGHAQQFVATAVDCVGECAAVRVFAQGAWVSGVSVVSDRVAASGGGVVSRLGAAR